MRDFKRSFGKSTKPVGKFGGGYGANSQRGSYSKDDERSDRRGEGRSRGRFSRNRSEFGAPKQAHEVVCDKCGKETTVPFEPRGNKPVYCRDCFDKKESRDYRPSREPQERQNDSSADLAKINFKLDKIMQALKIN